MTMRHTTASLHTKVLPTRREADTPVRDIDFHPHVHVRELPMMMRVTGTQSDATPLETSAAPQQRHGPNPRSAEGSSCGIDITLGCVVYIYMCHIAALCLPLLHSVVIAALPRPVSGGHSHTASSLIASCLG